MSFEKLTLNQRIQAANIDCMRHPKFALLSGIICMGKSEIKDGVPTAVTNGKDKFYGGKFIEPMNRKQVRYLVLHENFHVALKHCVLPHYVELSKKFGPRICNMAMDYVANGLIEELDPKLLFVERPTEALLVDKKFEGMSYPQVLKALLDDAEGEGEGEGAGGDGSMDEHEMQEGDGEECDGEAKGMSKAEIDKLSKMIDDANRQGEMLSRKMQGNEGGGRDILNTAQERSTNWREALLEFIQSICQGDDNSRYCPPNRRLLASGFILPSHFSETVGDIVVACDTSGSMHWAYPIVFGEMARICNNVRPDSVRILWWDTSVCGDQIFLPHEYDSIGTLLKPKGGGGTKVSCVAQHIKNKEIQAKALIMVTDGYIESDYVLPDMPVLWGVVDNDEFVPSKGKVIRIT